MVVHFGGNGHAACRLEGARAALAGRMGAPGLVDVPYPGFEGRPASADRERFLDAVAGFVRGGEAREAVAGYASGIGALVALGLRARGELTGLPLIFQGPVLWGLERRVFPRVMRRSSMARRLLSHVFTTPAFRERFARKQFRRTLGAAERAAFFEGYARCAALGPFFEWFTPGWLRALERAFAARPEGLDRVTVWLGTEDRVVDRREVDLTREALGVAWPVVAFPGWGHYPMIDDPEGWADALCDALARPDRLP